MSTTGAIATVAVGAAVGWLMLAWTGAPVHVSPAPADSVGAVPIITGSAPMAAPSMSFMPSSATTASPSAVSCPESPSSSGEDGRIASTPGVSGEDGGAPSPGSGTGGAGADESSVLGRSVSWAAGQQVPPGVEGGAGRPFACIASSLDEDKSTSGGM